MKMDTHNQRRPTLVPLMAIWGLWAVLFWAASPLGAAAEGPGAPPADGLISTDVQRLEEKYSDLITRTAEIHDVDPALVKAIILAESEYRVDAVSPQGASGLMQLMPRTAAEFGVKNLFDPKHNVQGGVKYLRWLLDRFDGRVKPAVAAYNAGITNVKRYGGVPPFKETRRYVRKVFRYYAYYQGRAARPEQV